MRINSQLGDRTNTMSDSGSATACKTDSASIKGNEDVSNTAEAKETKSKKEASSAETVNLKRSREEISNKSNITGDAEDNEPEEKRPAFRLNPPTLIHGQAKSKPVQEPEAPTTTPKRNFLRPSKLAAPTSSTSTLGITSASTNGQISSSNETIGLGMLAAAGSVSSSNPFLLPPDADKDQESETVFGSATTTESVKENGSNGEKTQKNSNNESKENTFLRPLDKDDKSSDGFVFGCNMGDRVVKSEADSSTETQQNNVEDSPAATEFVFGKNFSKRAKVATNDQTEGSEISSSSKSMDSSSSKQRKLEEDAAAMYAATNERNVIPEVEVITGEENEKNVLQIPCKLYQLDKKTENYTERGQGYLRVNDTNLQEDDGHFHSRLVMRTHGSLRLVLNVTVWKHMVIEKPSQKSVRIQTLQDGESKVFLVKAAVNDAEQLYRAVEYRVLRLKQLQEQETTTKAEESNISSTQEGDSESPTKVANKNNFNASSPKNDTSDQPPSSSIDKTDPTDGAKQSPQYH